MTEICKDKKSVCIIRSNPVRPDSRVEKEAWTLAEAGYAVRILAWDRSTNEYEIDSTICVANSEIPITRLGHMASFGEGFKNIKPYLRFQLHMRKWLKTHPFDIIHACDFDTAWASIGVARRKKQKYVFDIFDFLHSEPSSLFGRLVRKAQLHIINRADATIICTDERKRQIEGSSPKRLAVIHNTPSNEQISYEPFNVGESRRTKIVYVGVLQDYRMLLEIVEAVSASENLELHVGGFGKYEQYFIDASERYDNIKFYGRLSYDQTLALENACDIMLAIYDPALENHRNAAPNKFYESLMLGKPVVMVRGTGMSRVVEENDVGILIEYTKDSFLEGVDCLVNRKDDWQDMSIRMKKLYEESYSWDIMSSRLTEIYNEL